MIELLGINLSWVKTIRRNHLRRIIAKIQNGIGNWQQEEKDNEQFFTAFAMCRQKLQTEENQ